MHGPAPPVCHARAHAQRPARRFRLPGGHRLLCRFGRAHRRDGETPEVHRARSPGSRLFARAFGTDGGAGQCRLQHGGLLQRRQSRRAPSRKGAAQDGRLVGLLFAEEAPWRQRGRLYGRPHRSLRRLRGERRRNGRRLRGRRKARRPPMAAAGHLPERHPRQPASAHRPRGGTPPHHPGALS